MQNRILQMYGLFSFYSMRIDGFVKLLLYFFRFLSPPLKKKASHMTINYISSLLMLLNGQMHIIRKPINIKIQKSMIRHLNILKKAQEIPVNLDLVRDTKIWSVYYYVGLCYKQMNILQKLSKLINIILI